MSRFVLVLFFLVQGCRAENQPVNTFVLEGVGRVEDTTVTRMRNLVKNRAPQYSEDDHHEITMAILDAAQKEGVDALLVVALIEVESEFVAEAQSSKGALGFMQLLPGTLRELAKTESLEFNQIDLSKDHGLGIKLGMRYLTHLRKRFGGNLSHALMAYNAGPTRFRFARATGTLEPFEAYLENVKRHFSKLKTEFSEDPDFAGAALN